MSPPELALKQALAEVERSAEILRRQIQAAEDARLRARRIAGEFDRLREAGRAALALVLDGIERHTACARVARTRGLPVESVAHWLKEAERGFDARTRAQRDREILALAARGWTNGKIAARVGVCKRTVTRVIAAAYRT